MYTDIILAPNLSYKETFIDEYVVNSINTCKSNNVKKHPAGTNKGKKI